MQQRTNSGGDSSDSNRSATSNVRLALNRKRRSGEDLHGFFTARVNAQYSNASDDRSSDSNSNSCIRNRASSITINNKPAKHLCERRTSLLSGLDSYVSGNINNSDNTKFYDYHPDSSSNSVRKSLQSPDSPPQNWHSNLWSKRRRSSTSCPEIDRDSPDMWSSRAGYQISVSTRGK
ncbi:hypothetical protein BGZ99_000018 [Dissophora globulifera]|uniref:Uncharacterized protein n=1 Tax=Dissophora globulifera TaxID=979702 RepID=A0A9P6V156_9FUNG|nr:hypothetical protein BGZ99_000018 [Dissophora globulifera]